MKNLRGVVVKLVIGSFSLAALLGIVALLGGGNFGSTDARILLTTVIVGTTSIAMLCYLATADQPFQRVGTVGGIVALLPFTVALWLTWGGGDSQAAWKTFGVSVTVAASLAHVCLLLALAWHARAVVRRILLATLGLIAIVAAMIVLAVLGQDFDGELYWRFFGVVAILDVLGTISASALQKFGGEAPAATASGFDPALEARLNALAASRGVSRDQLVREALDCLVGPEA